MSIRVVGGEELDALSSDLQAAPRQAERAVQSVLHRGGNEMRRAMQSDFSGSRHFGHIAGSITYDVSGTRLEIGPDAARSSSAPLAGIAYFGGAHGGGGTVREPDYILEAEAHTAADWIHRRLGELL